MQSKQTLRVQDKDLEDIVKISAAHTSYIDQDYYVAAMGEAKRTD
jgi:hypothetical protein